MSTRAAAWLAWALAGLSVAMFVANVVLYFLTRSVQPPSSWGTAGVSGVLIFGVPFLAFPIVGALIASRRPKNPIGWICLAAGIFWMLANLSSGYGMYGLLARPGSVPFPAAIGSLGGWMWAPALGLMGTYLILLFPDGRLPSRRWRPLAWLSGAVIVLVSLSTALTPGRLPDLGGVPNPFGLEEYPWVAEAAQGVTLLLPLCVLASALSLVLRFVRSGGEEREQIKWLAFAAFVSGLGSSSVVIPSIILSNDAGGADPLWMNLLEDAETLSFAGVPVAVGIAILRYRLYEIRPNHKPHTGLRLTYGHAGRTLLRGRRGVAEGVRNPHRPAINPRGRCINPPDSSVVYPIEEAHPVVHRPSLLSQEIRREKDPRSLLCQAQGRDRPRRPKR
jgi:hypothetical protein